jgi:hypothetical protein
MSLVPWLCLGRDGLKNMESRFYCSLTIHEMFFSLVIQNLITLRR